MSETTSGGAATVLHQLHRASQSADDRLANRLNAIQLTPRQLTVLQAVNAMPEASQTALVNATGIDRSTLADIVKRLVDAGLLERERMSFDARMYAVRLSAVGQEKLQTVTPLFKQVADDVLSAVDPADREAFLRGLDAISETLGPVASARVSERAKSLKVTLGDGPRQD